MPQESWDIKKDEVVRNYDNIATYILFCEDGYHEPEYFKTFQIEKKLQVNTIERSGQHNQNFFNAINYCKDLGLIETVAGVDRLKEGVTEHIWCVYDRDENVKQPHTKVKDDFGFNLAIKNAIDAGLKVAWSNDCFELWVLLHFENVEANTEMSKDEIYARLTGVFAGEVEPHEEPFNYQKHLKPNFAQKVVPVLKAKNATAIENAEALVRSFGANTAYHDRNPCTMVHELVKELLSYH